MTREGARGQEYNAWSVGNGPEHIANLAFTRMLSGPMDFTPGIFDLGSKQAMDERNLSSTLAKQLALYVVLYSRSEEHTSELQSLMRISYAVFCLKKKKYTKLSHEH